MLGASFTNKESCMKARSVPVDADKRALILILAALLAGYGSAAGNEPGGPPPLEPWDGTIAAGFAGGSGSITDPWLISTGAQLAYLAREVNNGTGYSGEYVTLTGNLDLGGREWTAIGTDGKPFKGVFDGDNHVIYRLSVNKPDADYQGLFGYLDGAEIQRLGLESVGVTGKNDVGGIAGCVDYNSSVRSSYSTGTVSGTSLVGGVTGSVYNSSIKNSYSTGNVSGTTYAGGAAGSVYGGGIENSYSTGNVSGTTYAGGVAGYVDDGGSIEHCYSTGNVNGTSMVGGVAGLVVSSGSIENSYSAGNVSGTSMVGGIAGQAAGSGSIENSYSTGTVSGTGDYAGGIAGVVYAGSIVNCAALNPWVRAAASSAGRVAGHISGSNTFTGNAAWDGMGTNGGAVFNTNPDNAGTGITTAQVEDGSGLPAAFKTAPWDYTPGRLPVLSGLADQDDTLPAHLQ
jgi:hypothetical protein